MTTSVNLRLGSRFDSMATSLLHQLRSLLLIDVDSMDMRVSQRNTSDTEKFQDMTSNQALAYNEIIRPENAELVRQTINFIRDKDLDQDSDTFEMDVIDTLVCRPVVFHSIDG